MPYVVAGLLFVGVLCLINLLFTAGVVRRLRDHTRMLSVFTGAQPMLEPGEVAGDFTAETVDGTTVSRQALEDDTLVGFFSTTCEACVEQVPSFIAAAQRTNGGRSHVLAVVVGDAQADHPFVTDLRPVAQVVIEREDGPVSTAFDVHTFPAIGFVDAGGVIVGSGAQVGPGPQASTV